MHLVDGSREELRQRMTGVASAQATMMGKTMPIGPRWLFICLSIVALIRGTSSMDPEISLSKWVSSLPSMVVDRGRPNLIRLRMVISEFAKALPGKTDQIPSAEKIKGMTYDQIEAALRLRASKLAWLKYYLQNTLTAKDNGEKVILWVCWPLTQWLVEQVSTPSQSHFLPLISTLTFNSDTHKLWYLTLTLTLHMTILTVCTTAAS